jgi:hypothetical protein
VQGRAAADGISDEELAKMAEDAAPKQRKPAKGEQIEIPVPKISAVRAAIRKLARADKSPGNQLAAPALLPFCH